MAEVTLYGRQGEQVGTATLADSVFAREPNLHLVHEVMVAQLSNKRRGTAATKTKGEVEGGARKPWRQKKTGRARAGSTRSPLWRGGGTVFGPSPRGYAKNPTKKVRKAALASALSVRLRESRVRVVDDFAMAAPKTREFQALLHGLGVQAERVLVVLGQENQNVYLSARNIPGVSVVREWAYDQGENEDPIQPNRGGTYSSQGVTLYHVVSNDWIVILRSALPSLQQRLK
ncbi:MAG: 50S ribosomal protein L4 [Candidatus Schekmanbacteria bacterium]|nr:50S ribosomal protein L4 [Candidatus Schekmanbacteria bacterium]